MKLCVTICCLLTLCCGFSEHSIEASPAVVSAPKGMNPQTLQTDNVKIAVFTYQFNQPYSGRPSTLQYYFVCGGFFHKHPYDPDKYVMEHFKDFNPPVSCQRLDVPG